MNVLLASFFDLPGTHPFYMVTLPESSHAADALPDSAPARIYWGCHDSPFGPVLIGMSDEGIWRLDFASGYGIGYDLNAWQKKWPETEFIPDAKLTSTVACQLSNLNPWKWGLTPLALYGTEFQMRVWRAMLQLTPGQPISFANIASMIAKTQSERTANMVPDPSPYAGKARKLWESGGHEDFSRKQLSSFSAAQSVLAKR